MPAKRQCFSKKCKTYKTRNPGKCPTNTLFNEKKFRICRYQFDYQKLIHSFLLKIIDWLLLITVLCPISVKAQRIDRIMDLRDLNETEYSILNLSSTDASGRKFMVSSGPSKEKRTVGLFYSLWLGQHHAQQRGIYDIQKLLDKNPEDLNNPEGTVKSPLHEFHFWGEPLYGYYSMSDPWVITRHIELLSNASIDYLCIDATNNVVYPESTGALLQVLLSFQKQGFHIPKIVFYTNTKSGSTIDSLFDRYYRSDEYKSLWFCPKGKPMIIGITENNGNASDMTKYHSFSDFIKPEMLTFFDVRESQWPNGDYNPVSIPWMSWQYPQWNHSGSVAVPVAQHSHSVIYASSRHPECSRGYNQITKEVENDWTVGANFETMWMSVFSSKDPINNVLVTSFNEWMAIKYKGQSEGKNNVFFVDVFNHEFSRDIEMMKGGYNDNFYLQLVRNVRNFKFMKAIHYQYPHKTINIHKATKDTWKSVRATYLDYAGDAVPRDFINAVGTDRYTDNSNRNDITQIKVVHDRKNVYFFIKTKDPITRHNDRDVNWMNIYLSTSGDNSFEGYHYVINRKPAQNGITSVEKSTGGYHWEVSGEAEYLVNDCVMQISIPLKAIGLSKDNFSFEFKVSDNVTNYSDIMDYYITGDSAPIGRLNFSYGF